MRGSLGIEVVGGYILDLIGDGGNGCESGAWGAGSNSDIAEVKGNACTSSCKDAACVAEEGVVDHSNVFASAVVGAKASFTGAVDGVVLHHNVLASSPGPGVVHNDTNSIESSAKDKVVPDDSTCGDLNSNIPRVVDEVTVDDVVSQPIVIIGEHAHTQHLIADVVAYYIAVRSRLDLITGSHRATLSCQGIVTVVVVDQGVVDAATIGFATYVHTLTCAGGVTEGAMLNSDIVVGIAWVIGSEGSGSGIEDCDS